MPVNSDADCFSSLELLLVSFADNLLFGDEIITNGFHSCESDEDDRASHASSSDWTPRPRIGMGSQLERVNVFFFVFSF